jgi:hypothetical protein
MYYADIIFSINYDKPGGKREQHSALFFPQIVSPLFLGFAA